MELKNQEKSKSEQRREDIMKKEGVNTPSLETIPKEEMEKVEETLRNKIIRGFTKQEFGELQELHRLEVFEKFKAKHVKNNTALIIDGLKLAQQSEAIANIYSEIKQTWISSKLLEMGYPKDQKFLIDMQTGEIIKDNN